ncbi:MAG TPA: alkaline phosphatase family protein [Steroidobacteraceae bacterium]|nr:alkaline phosphatase family protein [Steroidobacteraceae bacterium]
MAIVQRRPSAMMDRMSICNKAVRWTEFAVFASGLALPLPGSTLAVAAEAAPATAVEAIATATPIKHVIIIVGENRSFDHLFATYVPKVSGETVLNLLSEKIVNADGTPGSNFAQAHQFKISTAPNGGKFFGSADLKDKTPYTILPAPDVNGVGAVSPYAAILNIPGGDPDLPPQDQFLFGTGGSGLSFTLGPDTRITNVNALPPGPFQMTGPTMPFDAFTGDTVHQFFQMVQQADCAIDDEHVSAANPTGCLHDLQSAIATTYNTPPGGTPHETGQTMAFFNMQQGDAPLLKLLADQYTMSDNYHQPVMGGTGPNMMPLGFADQLFFSDGNGNPATPAPAAIYNPDPQTGTLNLYTNVAAWFNCADTTQPGIRAIADYLSALPYALQTQCGAGQYWPAINVFPAFAPKGAARGGVPPTMQRSIGDVLTAHDIPWKYYGGGFNVDGTTAPLSGTYCSGCNPFEFEASYPALVADHMRDVTDLFADLANGTLPAVSYVKPDATMDGHPLTSKIGLFEAFVQNIVNLAQSNQQQWARTAIFVTVDESGGFYDSGFIQPVDFFGTGPRVPMIAVSPYSMGGHVSHVYNEHSSFVKFVERNWLLSGTLSGRSRDNLPNPIQDDVNVYVPRNMPAIGDLFDLFDFNSVSPPSHGGSHGGGELLLFDLAFLTLLLAARAIPSLRSLGRPSPMRSIVIAIESNHRRISLPPQCQESAGRCGGGGA